MTTTRRALLRRPVLLLAALAAVGAGCAPATDTSAPSGDEATATSAPPPTGTTTVQEEQRHPDVVDAELERTGDGWRVSATISSPYDTPDRYADAFRVLTPEGEELGVRELLHDHANEQPFTRSLDGVDIPDDVDRVVVEGRDLANGWGGDTVTVEVPR